MTSESTQAGHTARAVVVPRLGGSDVLEVAERQVGDPGPGQLLVRLAAAGVNFIDVYQRSGIYQMHTPFVLASEGAGTVEAVGPGVADFKAGDTVAWAQAAGSASSLVLVPAASAVPVPAGLDPEVAAAAMLQGLTAHYLVNSTYPVQAGDAVLIHAAAGGVGQLLVQLAKAKGATVIATAGSEGKLARARHLGADHVINYREQPDVAPVVRELTGGEGVAAVFDGVGRDTFDSSLASLRVRGMLVLFGGSSGQVPPFDLQRLNSGGSLFVTRPTLGHYLRTRDELLWRSSEMLGALADGSLELEIGGRYSFDDAAKAYDDLEGRRSTGKLLLLP